MVWNDSTFDEIFERLETNLTKNGGNDGSMDIDSQIDKLSFIRKTASEASLFEGLAEECTELAHGSLKLARILREESPTPATFDETLDRCNEEMVDLMLFLDVLSTYLVVDSDVYFEKLNRWVDRLKDKENENGR